MCVEKEQRGDTVNIELTPVRNAHAVTVASALLIKQVASGNLWIVMTLTTGINDLGMLVGFHKFGATVNIFGPRSFSSFEIFQWPKIPFIFLVLLIDYCQKSLHKRKVNVKYLPASHAIVITRSRKLL